MKSIIKILVLLAAFQLLSPPASAEDIVIGSKNFEENRLLCEMFARLIENYTDLTVERKFNLAGSDVCFEAVKSGEIDIYPEYTGTGLISLMNAEEAGSARETMFRVRTAFRENWNLWWFPSLGFENSYEIAVPRSLAEEHDLKTIGDLAPISPDLKARLGFEFIDRPDGLPLLAETYDLNFGEVIGMQQNLKLVAVESGDIDVLDVYTTDGTIIKYNLVVLEDDKDMFPPYEAAPLVNGNTFERYPEIYPALSMLEGALSPDMMRRLNRRLQEDKEPVERVAQDALEELGLVDAIQVDAISTSEHTLISYMAAEKAKLIRLTLNHLFMAAVAVLLGVLIAVPLGLLLERWRPGAEPVIRTIGLAQTIPSIALLAFMIPPFGIGIRPAIIALWIYSLFPILRSTFSGIRDADPQAVAAAHALGMTPAQILTQIRLPLAAPVIMAGVRTAAIITVGTATLAAFIGAGGLGEPIVTGLQTYDVIMILSGAIPAAVLAIVVDLILGGVEILVKPKGMVKSEY